MVNDSLLETLIERNLDYQLSLCRGHENTQYAFLMQVKAGNDIHHLIEEIPEELFNNITDAIKFEIKSFYDLKAKAEIDSMTN